MKAPAHGKKGNNMSSDKLIRRFNFRIYPTAAQEQQTAVSFYASSQVCHICGHRYPKTKDLSVREWTCPVCGTHHDRDVNAAMNIKQKALSMLAASA